MHYKVNHAHEKLKTSCELDSNSEHSAEPFVTESLKERK